jgi:L-ascorbate metabolism protein UlaG (beta-lactamase superfamily)
MSQRYSNTDPRHLPHDMKAVFRWGVLDRLSGRRRIRPPGPPAPHVAPDRAQLPNGSGPPRLTWIGHASFLGTLGGGTFLIDPIFSEKAGMSFRRYVPPGLALADLPRLDALLLTHCHYDHMDKETIRALPRQTPVVVPLGLDRWLRRWGFERITVLDWWESARTGPLRVTLVPACHWSRRWIADTNRTLWGGFVIEADGQSVYHAGDSAWFDGFAEIGRRFPGLLAAMLPIGSYSPAWFMEHHHLNPEQAGRAVLDLGARHFVPMHWGTFKLTDEPLAEPAERVRAWWSEQSPDKGRRLRLMSVGETVVLDD